MKSFLRFGRCFRILEGEVEDFMSVIQQFFHFDDGLEELVLGSTDVSHFAIIEFLSVGWEMSQRHLFSWIVLVSAEQVYNPDLFVLYIFLLRDGSFSDFLDLR